MIKERSIGMYFERAKEHKGIKCKKEFCSLLKKTRYLKDYKRETIEQAFSHYKDDALAGLEIKYKIVMACKEILRRKEK